MTTGDDRPTPDRPRERAGRGAAAARAHSQEQWVELQVRQAVARGDFEDLPGFGKPIDGLGDRHDPDWWVRRLVEREQITGVLPPALQLRKDDEELDGRLDRLGRETDVRREVEEFNERVRAAFYQPLGGPPLVTRQRDVEAEVERWRTRAAATAGGPLPPDGVGGPPESRPPQDPRRRWWRRR